MSKNLFRIPSSIAGIILNFLRGKESLVFILMYKRLNGVKEFIPKNYRVNIEMANVLAIFTDHKDIKKLKIDNFKSGMDNLVKYEQLEYFKCSSYHSELAMFLPNLVNLKKLSSECDDRITYDDLSHHPLLEKLTARLSYRYEDVHKLSLVKFKGSILDYNDYTDLALFFDDKKLEKLTLYSASNNFISFDKFTNLKCLRLHGHNMNNFNFLESLINLEILEITSRYCKYFIPLNHFSGLNNLKRLKLHSLEIPDDFDSSTTLANLEHLAIQGSFVGTVFHKILLFKQLTNLKWLHVRDLDSFFLRHISKKIETLILYLDENSDFRYIERLTSLRILYVSSKVRNRDMKYINRLKNLEKLSFDCYRLEINRICDISGLSKLKYLCLCDNYRRKNKFTKDNVRKYLSHLIDLDISC